MTSHPWVGPSDIADIYDVEAMAEALVVLADQIPTMLKIASQSNRRLDCDAVLATLQSRAGEMRAVTPKR